MEGLELKDFIEQSLVEICEAIASAREKRSEIAPKLEASIGSSKNDHSEVQFDLAVTVEKSEGAEIRASAGAKIISVISMGAKAAAKDEQSFSCVSRIKFSVPIYLMYESHEKRKTAPVTLGRRGNLK